MTKAKRLREALPTAAPGIDADKLAEKAGIARKSLGGVLAPFLIRGEAIETAGEGDAADRFYLNADYKARKGGGGRKAKGKKKATAKKKPARKPRAAAAEKAAPKPAADLSAAALVVRHVATTFALLESIMPQLTETEIAAFRAHQEALELLSAR